MSDLIQVEVFRISVPAMSIMGHGWGRDVANNDAIHFTGDHRPMRYIGEAIEAAVANDESPPVVEVEGWQILSRAPVSEAEGWPVS